jgi:competence protein ComEC
LRSPDGVGTRRLPDGGGTRGVAGEWMLVMRDGVPARLTAAARAVRVTAAGGVAAARERPRHVVLGALVAGLLAGPTAPALAALAGLAAAALVGPRPIALLAAAAALAGVLTADMRLAALDHGVLARMQGRSVTGRATLLEPLRTRGQWLTVARVRLLDGAAAGEQAVLRARPGAFGGRTPEVGDELALTATVSALGRFDAYQRRRNAHAALDASRVRLTGRRRGGLAGALDSARRRAEAGLRSGLAPPEAALLRGMVLGEDEQLSRGVRQDFQRSGLAHILAVSGQNVMLLAALAFAAGALLGLALHARLLVVLALIAVYVPLAGGGPSIQRAGVMGAAGIVAALAGRPAQRWYAVGLAAAVTLAINPRSSSEPGWQLSFAAVVALLALAAPLRARLARRLPAPIADAAAVTLAATLGTAPLMAADFDRVSLASLPANLIAAPAVAPIMWLGMLGAAAAQASPLLATAFSALAGPLLVFVTAVAHVAAAAPLAVIPVHLGSPAAVGAAYAGLAAASLAVLRRWRDGPAERGLHAGGGRGVGAGAGDAVASGTHVGVGPAEAVASAAPEDAELTDAPLAARLRDRRRRAPPRRLLAGLAVTATVGAALVVARAAGGAPPALAPGELVVSFLDIGQGDATLLQTRAGAILVDTGPPDGPILRRLAQAHVRRLDALVLTHAQADHEGAAPAVMRAYDPRLVIDGGSGWPSRVQRALPPLASAEHARMIAPEAGETVRLGALTLRVLWPPPRPPDWRPSGDPNETAVVALASDGPFRLLLTADAESDVTGPLDLPTINVLKVAHHGSADPGLPALLTRLRPRIAVIEVGRHNAYGHPAPSTLAALRSVPTVVRTDRDGTIRLDVHDGRMTLRRHD